MRHTDSGIRESPEGNAPLIYTSLGTLFNALPEFYPIYTENVKKMSAELKTPGGEYAADAVIKFIENCK